MHFSFLKFIRKLRCSHFRNGCRRRDGKQAGEARFLQGAHLKSDDTAWGRLPFFSSSLRHEIYLVMSIVRLRKIAFGYGEHSWDFLRIWRRQRQIATESRNGKRMFAEGQWSFTNGECTFTSSQSMFCRCISFHILKIHVQRGMVVAEGQCSLFLFLLLFLRLFLLAARFQGNTPTENARRVIGREELIYCFDQQAPEDLIRERRAHLWFRPAGTRRLRRTGRAAYLHIRRGLSLSKNSSRLTGGVRTCKLKKWRRPVLCCIEAKVCNQILIFQHFFEIYKIYILLHRSKLKFLLVFMIFYKF